MATFKCTQTKCIYHTSKGHGDSCPECAECGAESNIINDNCVNCWNCLSDEGYIRNGLPKALKQDIKQKMKIIEEEVAKEEGIIIISPKVMEENKKW